MDILEKRFGSVKVYESWWIKILQLSSLLIFPLMILFRNYSWWKAILIYVIGFIVTNFVSSIIAHFLIRYKHAHKIVVAGMILGTLSVIYGFNQQYKDGTYCARVEYYNPSTTTRSQYNLTIEIEDNRVVMLEFPNGGWLDSDHFTPPELSYFGHATIVDHRNYQYTIKYLEEGKCEFRVIGYDPESIENADDLEYEEDEEESEDEEELEGEEESVN